MSNPITLFYSNGCGGCHMFKKLIDEQHLNNYFKPINIEKNANLVPPGVNAIPTIIVQNKILTGNDAFEWVKTVLIPQIKKNQNNTGNRVRCPPQQLQQLQQQTQQSTQRPSMLPSQTNRGSNNNITAVNIRPMQTGQARQHSARSTHTSIQNSKVTEEQFENILAQRAYVGNQGGVKGGVKGGAKGQGGMSSIGGKGGKGGQGMDCSSGTCQLPNRDIPSISHEQNQQTSRNAPGQGAEGLAQSTKMVQFSQVGCNLDAKMPDNPLDGYVPNEMGSISDGYSFLGYEGAACNQGFYDFNNHSNDNLIGKPISHSPPIRQGQVDSNDIDGKLSQAIENRGYKR